MSMFSGEMLAKANKVNQMIDIKRKFLTAIFEREKRTMLKYYQGKKKFKKVLNKM